MKYEKCLTCKQLGAGCDGPNLLLMDTAELGQWCNELRKLRKMTYDGVTAEAAMSKTAVYGFLTSANHECRIDTCRSVAKVLIGGNYDDNPCGNVSNSEKAAYEERIRQIERDIEWYKKQVEYLEKDNAGLQTLVTNTNKRHTASQEFMRIQIKGKNKAILILAILLGVCLVAIIAALIVDKANLDKGFFWLRSWLGGSHSPIKLIGS